MSGWERRARIHPAEAAVAFFASAAFFLLAAAAIPVRDHLVVVFILGGVYVYVVLAVARRRGPLYAVPLAIAGGLALDSFYIPPVREFGAAHWQNWLVVAIYISMGVFIGLLGARSQRLAQVSEAARSKLAEEQAALRRVATLVAHGVPPGELFGAVAEEVARLRGADLAGMIRYEADDTVTAVGGWSAAGDLEEVGSRLPLEVGDLGRTISMTGRPARIGDYDVPGPTAALTREKLGVRSSVGSPILVEGRLWGALFVYSTQAEPLPADTESRMEEFTELVATAISNIEARLDLAASRARIVAATDETRRRFERDLHDGVQQRLVSLTLELRNAETMTSPDLGRLQGHLSGIGDGLAGVLDDLRELSRGIHPAILSEGGLGPALGALARRSAVPTRLDVRVDTRLEPQVEVAVYYVISEALTNAAKHAEASVAEVHVDARDHVLDLRIHDDGVGGADPARGTGLIGLRDRVEALGGTIAIVSLAGEGTSLHVELPSG